jgi:hypothetical protein
MVLFQTENISGISDIHAIITPTTKGIRKTLKDEGISYTMPLMEKSSANFDASPEKENINTSTETAESTCTNDEKKGDDDEECETNEWLEKIGLKNSNLRVLQSTRSTIRQENSDSVDNKPQSTLLVQGGDVQALFNFFLNSKILITNTGPMSGVPPTLLSHQCFIGATMQKLKVSFFLLQLKLITGRWFFRFNKQLLKIYRVLVNR